MTSNPYPMQPEDVDLIRAIVAANCPTPINIPDRLSALSKFEVRCLDMALGRELIGYGFTVSDTPTDYGRVVEWILDRLQYVELRGD